VATLIRRTPLPAVTVAIHAGLVASAPEIGRILETEVRTRTPVRTGALRRSVKVSHQVIGQRIRFTIGFGRLHYALIVNHRTGFVDEAVAKTLSGNRIRAIIIRNIRLRLALL